MKITGRLVFILAICALGTLMINLVQHQKMLSTVVPSTVTPPSTTTNRHPNAYQNPPPTGPVPWCTKEQRINITKQLSFPTDYDLKGMALRKIQKLKWPRARWLRCPNPSWLTSYYREESVKRVNSTSGSRSDDEDYFLGISVGCNKGHDAIRTARMGMFTPEFDANQWGKAFHKNATITRGGCKQEFSSQATINAGSQSRTGEMHCIEPMPSTFHQLQAASEQLGLHAKGLLLTHAAIAGISEGTIRFPKASSENMGQENVGIHSCNEYTEKCEDVPVYSLERYVERFVRKKHHPINILQIDVEGWDFDVLFGASSVLDKTHYLEFEYHNTGSWKNLHLQDAVMLLDGKGFVCYWAAAKRLWRITSCYFEFYNHWHGWSNIACVHSSQSGLYKRMEELFLETLKSW